MRREEEGERLGVQRLASEHLIEDFERMEAEILETKLRQEANIRQEAELNQDAEIWLTEAKTTEE